MDLAERASELNSMIATSIYHDFEKEEDEESINSDEVGFGFGAN